MSLNDPNLVSPQRPKRVALVIANPAVSTTTGWPVVFGWSERAQPYYEFAEKGYQVDLVQAGLWRGFAIRNGNLFTGQPNFSGAETPTMIINALGE